MQEITHFTFVYNLLFENNHMTPPNHKRTESALNVSGNRKKWNYLTNSTSGNYIPKFKIFEFLLDYLWHYFSILALFSLQLPFLYLCFK